MAGDDALTAYRAKRDPEASPEPSGDDRARAGQAPFFVVQKHAASSPHYDFRLQVDGVLKSWAVPKGLLIGPRETRLAIETEDHPLDYADFEDVTPVGEYGGGTVPVWDADPYVNAKRDGQGELETSMADCIADGHLTVERQGKKLAGGYSLIPVRTENGQGQDKRQGKRQRLLVKIDDPEAEVRRNPVSTEPGSALSDRGIGVVARAARSPASAERDRD